MGFWSRTLGLDKVRTYDIDVNKRSWDDPSYTLIDPAFADVLGVTSTFSGESVDEIKALNVSSVYRAINVLAGTIASLPLRSIETDEFGRKSRKKSWLDNPYGPDYLSTQFEWVETVVAHIVLHGNAYLFKLIDGAGRVVGAVPLHPLMVRVEEDLKAPGKRVFKVRTDNGKEVPFSTAEIMHIPALSMDGITGVSVLSQARNSIASSLSGERAAGRAFKEGPLQNTIVTPSAGEDFTPDEAEAVADGLRAKLGGADNAGKLVLINKALTLSKYSMSMVDAQFLETRVFQVEEIARWFGVPPHLLSQTEKQTSWGSGVSEQNLGLARFTLMPITSRIEQRLSRLLTSKLEAEFDYSSFLRPSPEKEIDLILKQMNGGLITPNEARAIRNLPPIEGQDNLRLPPGSLTPEQMAGGDSEDSGTEPNRETEV